MEDEQPSTNVYLTNIPTHWKEYELKEHFIKYGPIQSVRVLGNRGIGFVKFENINDAISIVSGPHSLSGSILPGSSRPLGLKFAKEPREDSEDRPERKDFRAEREREDRPAPIPGPNIHMTPLPPSMDTNAFKKLMSEYGPVRSCVVLTDQKSGKSRCIGLCCFESQSVAEKTLRALDGTILPGAAGPLQVSFSTRQKTLSNAPARQSPSKDRDRRRSRSRSRGHDRNRRFNRSRSRDRRSRSRSRGRSRRSHSRSRSHSPRILPNPQIPTMPPTMPIPSGASSYPYYPYSYPYGGYPSSSLYPSDPRSSMPSTSSMPTLDPRASAVPNPYPYYPSYHPQTSSSSMPNLDPRSSASIPPSSVSSMPNLSSSAPPMSSSLDPRDPRSSSILDPQLIAAIMSAYKPQ